MAKAKKLSAYGEQMFDIMDIVKAKQIFEIPFQTREEASAFRFEFYGFRAAARKEDAVELIRQLEPIKAWIKDTPTGATLTFAHVDIAGVPKSALEAIARAKEEMLEMFTPTPPQVPSEPLGKPIDHMEAYMEKMYGDVAAQNGVQPKGEGK